MDRMKSDDETRISSLEVEINCLRSEAEERSVQFEKLKCERNDIRNEMSLQRTSFAETLKAVSS